MILDDIILPILKLFLFRTVLERMPRAQAKKAKAAAGRPATDADEAMEDARAEVEDVAAAV
jgi:chromosome segregation ATPase